MSPIFRFSRHQPLQDRIETAIDALKSRKILTLFAPTGCGKTFLIQQIATHLNLPEPVFVAAASLDGHLLESTLFGHVKGAFSGAVKDQPGLAALAGQGILAIEGLEELSGETQAKMLRFIQERSYRAVGDREEKTFNGILIFTSRATDNTIREYLREDFFFRIQGNTLELPPLHQRPEDLEDWVENALIQVRKEVPHPKRQPEAADLNTLRDHPIPGNGHGLQAMLLRAAVSGAPLQPPPSLHSVETAGRLPDLGSLKADLDILEKQLIERALAREPDSRDALARRLGLSRRALQYKLKHHDLLDPS